MSGRSMGSHQSARAKSTVWLTPPFIIDDLGPFDLDPCAAIGQPLKTARTQYTKTDDGLSQQWHGYVWCNPPYGREASAWLEKMAQHQNGIALIFARTETVMFFNHVWPFFSSLLFIRGRLHFHYPTGKRCPTNSGAPSVLVGYGDYAADRLRASGIPGALVDRSQLDPA